MKVCTGGNLGLSREYHKKLFGPLFYPWWNCPLNLCVVTTVVSIVLVCVYCATHIISSIAAVKVLPGILNSSARCLYLACT